MVLISVAVIAVLAACSSPVVTGMKVHMQSQEYDEIIHLADSVIARGDSLNAEIWFWKGIALSEKVEWPEATESFIKANELDSNGDLAINEYWYVFFNCAANSMNSGDIGYTVEILNAGMAIAPERPDFELLMGDIELNVNNNPQAALNNFLNASQKAEVLMANLQAIIDGTSDPYMLDYYSQSLSQAKNLFVQSLYNSGSIFTVMAINATGEEMQEYIQEAKDVYLKVLEIDPANVDILDALAGAYMLEGDYDSAIGIFDEAFANIEIGISEGWLEQDEANAIMANMLVSIGYAYIEMEEFQMAITELNNARDLIGDDFIILSTLAHANFVMENYDEALSIIGSVIMMEGLIPDELANAYYMRYACYNRKEMDSEAAEALETAIDFQPDNSNYWRYLASTYSRLGRRNDAISAMEKAEALENSANN